MCLGIPGRVLSIDGAGEFPMAVVDFGGLRREACLAYVPDAAVGDFVIVHVGFAISRLDEDEARRTLEVLRAMPEAVAAELGPADLGPADLGPVDLGPADLGAAELGAGELGAAP
ncbi:MAG TPA: HypC/HybG/HupF family hydrogenase formation chaperone [Mycobacteriales bacterium]|nr:HypC/HybG/HupF family hydrogenase formation chaperone [Mycobacteriales bacterium]